MFFPIGDDNSDRRTTPYINYLFIAINVLVFIFLQKMGTDWRFTYAYATVPAEILTGHDVVSHSKVLTDVVTGERIQIPGLQVTPINVYLTLFTSMFMHGGWAHLFGNMLFLLIFGDNIEDAMGHRRYFTFYLLCGVLAGLSHVLFTAYTAQSVFLPSLGASGAISGVMGGYILLFPARRVKLWIFFFIVAVPAVIAVGLWFVFQVLSGLGMLGGDDASGVAYAAHIGGFIAGLLLVKAFDKPRQVELIKKEKPRW
ncbi:rhomboid family intramembrane serine protease [Flavisolibacter nicotianae]|uniref:rhomboid family intramembrane serine protease n=1 Tax=Flavisolibacter nicotianae TaxID=2364882 RepID=UPI000EB1544E|nr:rhomboid family intramembrane serine protease [Flavisolibacter nicotianae]